MTSPSDSIHPADRRSATGQIKAIISYLQEKLAHARETGNEELVQEYGTRLQELKERRENPEEFFDLWETYPDDEEVESEDFGQILGPDD